LLSPRAAIASRTKKIGFIADTYVFTKSLMSSASTAVARRVKTNDLEIGTAIMDCCHGGGWWLVVLLIPGKGAGKYLGTLLRQGQTFLVPLIVVTSLLFVTIKKMFHYLLR
jgi:hypothetical protein